MELRLDDYVHDVLSNTNATHYVGFVGSTNPTFRHNLAVTKPYKGTRKTDEEAKKWWAYLSQHLVDKWNFVRVDGIEAEDGVSIAAYEIARDLPDVGVVICHVDKDVDQVPGPHYDYKKRTKYIVTPERAQYNLWYQMVVGDSVDNVPGLPRKGEAYALKLLYEVDGKPKSPEDMEAGVKYAYSTYASDEMYNEQLQLISLLKCDDSLKYALIPYTNLFG